jgi:methyl acetate hydrolase
MGTRIDGSAIDKALQEAVGTGAVPHVAAIAADRDGVIYEGGAGVRIAGESDDPVTTATQFRIMSMTKMVCTTAALQQVERGELDLDAPVDTYLPAFADLQVLDGFDDDDTPRLRAPASRATVRNLVTHTSGLGYWFFDADLMRYEQVTGLPNVVPGKAEAFKAPLVADPGTIYTYGINTDWLGRVVEAVAGTALDVVVKEKITGPLGMDDTMFRLDEHRYANCVALHVPGEDRSWVSSGEILNQTPDWWAGGHGLYSTPRDYVRFERMLLRGGELDGERILTQETVDAAFTNQIGDLDFPPEIPTADPPVTASFNAGPGWKWGYGLLLNTTDIPGMRRAGTGAWAGLFNTHFFVDRTTGICASIYTNSLPFVTEGPWTTYQNFERALYASL